MGMFGWLFGKKYEESAEAMRDFPWDRQPSIYQFIHAHIRTGQKGLSESGQTLPDEGRLAAMSQIRWAAGAMDGVSTHHIGSKDTDQAKELLKLARMYWTSPTANNKAKLYDFLVEHRVVCPCPAMCTSLSQLSEIAKAGWSRPAAE